MRSFKNIVAALPFERQQGRCVGEGSLYNIIVLFTARRASLGLGQPEVKPSTPEPMPVRLKELTGKLGWMKWEPLPLFSEGRRSRERCVKWSEEAEANKGGRKRR